MDICVQTSDILDVFGIDAGFRMIADAGFDSVDFNIDHTLPYSVIAEGKTTELYEAGVGALLEATEPYKRAAEKYGVRFNQMHAPFPTYVKNEFGCDYVMKSIKYCADVCGYIGCKYMIVHPAFLQYSDKLDPKTEHRINIERYTEMIPSAKKNGVIICLENMFTGYKGKMYGACCADMSEANAYIDELNAIAGEKRFAFCLDVGHALLAGKEIYSAITELGDRLETLHLHDNDGVNDRHLFPYAGVLDWERCLSGLRDIGYKNALSFETFNGMRVIDQELAPDALKYLAAIGRLFAKRVGA